jgi:hypothetical protein
VNIGLSQLSFMIGPILCALRIPDRYVSCGEQSEQIRPIDAEIRFCGLPGGAVAIS